MIDSTASALCFIVVRLKASAHRQDGKNMKRMKADNLPPNPSILHPPCTLHQRNIPPHGPNAEQARPTRNYKPRFESALRRSMAVLEDFVTNPSSCSRLQIPMQHASTEQASSGRLCGPMNDERTGQGFLCQRTMECGGLTPDPDRRIDKVLFEASAPSSTVPKLRRDKLK